MRLRWILGLAVCAVAFAQVEVFIKELPACAVTCITGALPVSNCSFTDLNCICASKPLYAASQKCVEQTCTAKEAITSRKVSGIACNYPIRDRGLTVGIVGPLLTFISLIMVVSRLTVRRPWPFSNGLFGWDDAFIVLAFLAAIPLAVFDGLYYLYGIGQDIWELPYDHITLLLKYYWAGEMPYLFSTVLVKISLLLFFLRVFPNYHFKLWCKVLIGICAAFGVSFFFALVFQCSPVDYTWLRWDGEHTGSCVNVFVGGYMHAALNMVLDIIVLVTPMPLLYKLQFGYSMRQKLHAIIMFSFGLLATIVSALRLQSLVSFGHSKNPSWDYWAAAIWTQAEMQACIICACLPATKVLLVKILPGWMVTRVRSTAPNGNSGPTPRKRNSVEPAAIIPASGKQMSSTTYNSNDPSKRGSRIKSGGGPFGVVSITSMSRNEDSSGFTELVDLEDGRSPPGTAL